MDKSTEKILKLVSEKDWTDYCVMRQRWYDDGREDTLRIDYLLDADSVVFDVGAYQGGWTADLLKRCGVIPAAVYLFEPVFEFHQTASKRFENTPQIKVLNFALSDRDGEAFIDVDGGSSSLHLSGETLTKTQDIVGFIQQERLAKIDLIVDDGSHNPVHQVLTIKMLFPLLGPKGIYICEDIRQDGGCDPASIRNSLTESGYKFEMKEFRAKPEFADLSKPADTMWIVLRAEENVKKFRGDKC
jgi:FkbM family methyltransferase